MARTQGTRVAAAFLIFSAVLAGCAKRPATTATTAPAPAAGAAATTPAGAAPVPGAAPPAPGAIGAPSPAAPGPTISSGPAEKLPAPREFVSIDALKDIHFDFDRYDIRPADARILDENARWMAAPDSRLLVEGHADDRGTNEYNLALGERRTKAAMNYLVARGVQAGRITIISYGEERPLCSERNEACWARNRRAYFLVKAR